MLDGILSAEQLRVLKEERRLLTSVAEELAAQDIPQEDRAALAASVEQLDDLFLVVVVGEFNAGKSTLLNALVGEPVLAEGVTPTTSRIHLLRWGETVSRSVLDDGVELVQLPLPLLREVTLVDTPGTNALERRHEALTDEYVPRSDLVLFVTSADRPFSESERVFLERVREWGKKVVVVVNKVDILRGDGALEEILGYIREHGENLLGVVPKIFPVSAVQACDARASEQVDGYRDSGLPDLEVFLREVLDRGERVRLKLGNPIGVAERLITRTLEAVGRRQEVLVEDQRTLEDIDRQLGVYSADVRREFELRLSDMDGVLKGLELRGVDFFDQTLRLGRLPQLFNKERLRDEFEARVVDTVPAELETKVESLIDWLIASDLNQWQAVVQHVNKRRSVHENRVVGEIGSQFDYDRESLLNTLGREARESLETYDRAGEARTMAEDVQKAVAGTALVEAGAIGLGATVAFLASTTAADVTGLAAAGILAAVGLFILPHRRRRAKNDLRDKVSILRARVMNGLTSQFETEATRAMQRIQDTIAPYDRFVRGESAHLEGQSTRLSFLAESLTDLRRSILNVTEE
ncbi:MAG: dynamin family protein [Thermoanaerobaculales bacterium]|nr:dynamin family protein [Thermoanaerobaculales bacterium]